MPDQPRTLDAQHAAFAAHLHAMATCRDWLDPLEALDDQMRLLVFLRNHG